ncbi:MAG: hypothetical protein SOV43_06285 [Selenomonadaceae bacterium]|nr:DUF3847 domain-containing protein [Selenomonadaceae bacterium]MDY2685763.1 hypothetical protein [Selenomonadaceae bacterium]
MTRQNQLTEKLHRQQEQLLKHEFQEIRLEHELAQAKRKARTHRLITLGAEIEACLGSALTVEEVRILCSYALEHGYREFADSGNHLDAAGVHSLSC